MYLTNLARSAVQHKAQQMASQQMASQGVNPMQAHQMGSQGVNPMQAQMMGSPNLPMPMQIQTASQMMFARVNQMNPMQQAGFQSVHSEDRKGGRTDKAVSWAEAQRMTSHVGTAPLQGPLIPPFGPMPVGQISGPDGKAGCGKGQQQTPRDGPRPVGQVSGPHHGKAPTAGAGRGGGPDRGWEDDSKAIPQDTGGKKRKLMPKDRPNRRRVFCSTPGCCNAGGKQSWKWLDGIPSGDQVCSKCSRPWPEGVQDECKLERGLNNDWVNWKRSGELRNLRPEYPPGYHSLPFDLRDPKDPLYGVVNHDDWPDHRERAVRGGAILEADDELHEQGAGSTAARVPGSSPSGGPAKSKWDMGPRGAAEADWQTSANEKWYATLPEDKLLPAELELREALLTWARERQERPELSDSPPLLANAASDPDIKRHRQAKPLSAIILAILPPGVKLGEWIERRIGAEIELKNVDDGQQEVVLTGEGPEDPDAPSGARGCKPAGGGAQHAAYFEEKSRAQEAKEAFFASLPEDAFSSEEEDLRGALLDFLDNWTEDHPAKVTDAATTPGIAQARRAVLPRGCPVSLKEWIDRRIGGEIETRPGPNGLAICGLRGTLDDPGSKRRRLG